MTTAIIIILLVTAASIISAVVYYIHALVTVDGCRRDWFTGALWLGLIICFSLLFAAQSCKVVLLIAEMTKGTP